MIIDAFTHGLHGGYLDRIADAGGDWARERVQAIRRITRKRPQFLDPAVRVRLLDRHGIDRQVVTLGLLDINQCPGDVAAKLALTRAVNEAMARFGDESKGRLVPVGTIAMETLDRGGQREMEHAINGLGLKGFLLPSSINGKPLDLPEFEPFWAGAAEMDAAVYIHPQEPAAGDYPADYVLTHAFGLPYNTSLTLGRLVLSGLMERYPGLKIISHHLGGMLPFFLGRLNETYINQVDQGRAEHILPRPLPDYFSRFYYDTAVGGSAAAVRCACDVFGAGRLVFATDFPWGPGGGEPRLDEYPKIIEALGLPEAGRQMIFEGNISQLLGLSGRA